VNLAFKSVKKKVRANLPSHVGLSLVGAVFYCWSTSAEEENEKLAT